MNRSLQVRPSWILEPQSLPLLFPCFTWFTPDLPVSPFSLLICQIFSWNRNHNVSNFSLYVLFASLRGHCSLDFLWLPPEATILTAAGITSFQICWSSTGKANVQFKPWCYKNRFFLLFKVFLCQDQKNLVIGEILLSLGIMSLHRVVRKKQWFPFSVFLRYAFHWIGNIKGVH